MAMDAGSISGTVVDASSQSPVGGARVMLVRIVEADAVADSESVVVFETPSGRQPVKIHVMDANVTGVTIVATP